jgi:hypothetical protein
MIARTLTVMAVLAAGGIFTGAMYWGLLNTPEANALTVGLSALLVITILAALAVTVNTAILTAQGVPLRDAVRRATRGAGWFVLALIPLVLAWAAIIRGDRWIADHQGEINAWFIARFGWADISRLLQAEAWISQWLRWTVVPVACLSLLAARLSATPAARGAWLRRALHWRTLFADLAVFVLLFALPWRLTAWRPQLPPTWVEPTVAAIRLATFALLSLAGAAVLILFASRDRTSPQTARGGVE